MQCRNCGCENEEEFIFCKACGQRLIAPKTDQTPQNAETPPGAGDQNNEINSEINTEEAISDAEWMRQKGYDAGATQQWNAGQVQQGYDAGATRQWNAGQTQQNGYDAGQTRQWNTTQNAQWNANQNPQWNTNQNPQWNADQTQQYGWTGMQPDFGNGSGEDPQWEEEQRRRAAARRKARQEEQQRKENRRIVIIGIIVAAAIAASGIAAFFGIRYFMDDSSSASEGSVKISSELQEELDQRKNTPTPVPTQTPEETAEPTPSSEPTPTITTTPEPTPEIISAEVKKASSVSTNGYQKVSIKSAEASSTIDQEGYNNSIQMTYDGDEKTSWQEGADGDGLGEVLHYTLSQEYDVRYITFKMGNWRDQNNYDVNNRPKGITVWFGDQSYQVTIPDGKTEYCLELSGDITCSEIYIRIDSVYSGSEYDDTCISEIGIYGK